MRSAEGLAKTSLARGAVFNGSGELLGWEGSVYLLASSFGTILNVPRRFRSLYSFSMAFWKPVVNGCFLRSLRFFGLGGRLSRCRDEDLGQSMSFTSPVANPA